MTINQEAREWIRVHRGQTSIIPLLASLFEKTILDGRSELVSTKTMFFPAAEVTIDADAP